MYRYLLFVFTIVFLVNFTQLARAQDSSACDGLQPSAQAVVKDVLSSTYPYDCCDETIEKCLNAKSICPLVTSLKNQACRHAAEGRKAAEIKRILEQRALTMTETKAVKIEKSTELLWGNADSQVVLSIYLCGRCQFCAKHIPALIKSLEEKKLMDKVAINLRLYPIKSHENSAESAIAIEAAARMGKGKEFILLSFSEFDSFSLKMLNTWADKLGLDVNTFSEMMKDSQTRKRVVDMKKEGLQNGVDSTPTLFINGKKIRQIFNVDDIIDILLEEISKL